jgi:hypothetical protein
LYSVIPSTLGPCVIPAGQRGVRAEGDEKGDEERRDAAQP